MAFSDECLLNKSTQGANTDEFGYQSAYTHRFRILLFQSTPCMTKTELQAPSELSFVMKNENDDIGP